LFSENKITSLIINTTAKANDKITRFPTLPNRLVFGKYFEHSDQKIALREPVEKKLKNIYKQSTVNKHNVYANALSGKSLAPRSAKSNTRGFGRKHNDNCTESKLQ